MSLQDEIQTEIRSLKQSLSKIDRTLDAAPPGTLRLSPGRKGRTYFYIQYSDGNGNIQYEYLSNRNRKTIAELAQKSYYKKLRPLIVEECNQLETFLYSYRPDAKSRVFEQLCETRQGLVKPMYMPLKEIIRLWSFEEFLQRTDCMQQLRYATDRGEYVRTRSEAALANLLYSNRHRLLYRYEAALFTAEKDVEYPTFTILSTSDGKKYYWEHVILDNDSQYVNGFVRKINTYAKAGIYPGENLIITFESNDVPLDLHVARCLIKHYFVNR